MGKEAHEEADKDRQKEPAYDFCTTLRLVIEIVVVNHAISFAGIAPERARPNVGDSFFCGGYGVSPLNAANASVLELTIKLASTSVDLNK